MTAPQTDAGRPRPGTRPANRRELVLAAAGKLFYDRGYDQVSMGDIAEAVAIGPSALYRHFSSKQELLFEVMKSSLALITTRLEAMSSPFRPDWTRDLVAAGADVRLGLLWQRETGHLSEAQRTLIHTTISATGQLTTDLILRTRPELSPDEADFLAWGTLTVLLSPGFQRSRDTVDPALMAAIVSAVVHSPAPVPQDRPVGPSLGLQPRSRRERLLTESVRLFAARGYPNVGIEDIGAALGIAGPSVYNHFATKADILVTALTRGWAYLQMDLGDVLASSPDTRTALRGMIDSYVRLGVRHPEIVSLILTETRHLPEDSRNMLRQAQREYLAEWVAVVRANSPDLTESEARARLAAVVALVNNQVRTPHLRDRFDMAPSLAALCTPLLTPR
ncbi:TetR/AcrR family transcriptional regulator [Streptomyces sp. NPDC006733]|uniref:TetR/AcrR family transcriptional regulator n=1 Tax=Streptomyces sp. NPDC006733 TaxID=3155460 RepID=UPI00340C1D64